MRIELATLRFSFGDACPNQHEHEDCVGVCIIVASEASDQYEMPFIFHTHT